MRNTIYIYLWNVHILDTNNSGWLTGWLSMKNWKLINKSHTKLLKRHHLLNGRQSEKILILSRKLNRKNPKTFKQHKDNKSKFSLNNKIKETKADQTNSRKCKATRKKRKHPTNHSTQIIWKWYNFWLIFCLFKYYLPPNRSRSPKIQNLVITVSKAHR